MKNKKTTRKIETSNPVAVAPVALHGKRALPIFAGNKYTLGSDTVALIGASSTIVTAIATDGKRLTVRDSDGKTHSVKFANIGLPVALGIGSDGKPTDVIVPSSGGKFVAAFTNPVAPVAVAPVAP